MSNYNQEVIEISDDEEQTYYGSDFSISEDSDDDSSQFLCEIKTKFNFTEFTSSKDDLQRHLTGNSSKDDWINHKKWK